MPSEVGRIGAPSACPKPGLVRRKVRQAKPGSFSLGEKFAGPSGAHLGLSNFSPGCPELDLGCRKVRRAVLSSIWAVEKFDGPS